MGVTEHTLQNKGTSKNGQSYLPKNKQLVDFSHTEDSF